MAIHNTPYDAANTAVRAFLTKVGAKYWGKTYNTGSGQGKAVWLDIRNKIFEQKCCYCGEQSGKLQIEHLIMFNRDQYGLHHPGNTVPVCTECNKRGRDKHSRYLDWVKHLKMICGKNNTIDQFEDRRQKILNFIRLEKYAYPVLTENEKHSIRVIAESLYNNIKSETENSLNLYEKITDAFVISSE